MGKQFKTDTIKTSAGDLKITFIGHGTLMFTFGEKVIHIDPVGREADYTTFPKADIIMITHEHPDHLDTNVIESLRTKNTILILTETVARQVSGGIIMKHGNVRTIDGMKIQAMPAYNIIHMRSPGVPFHPKGIGNGYVITFGDKKVYVSGDAENIPEMGELQGIDIAFLPMNMPYTMTPEMVANAANSFKPKILYPYHYGDTDTSKILELLKEDKDIEVRIRDLK